MLTGDNERVPFCYRDQWEKRNRVPVGVDDMGGFGPVHYATEDAGCFDAHDPKYDSQLCDELEPSPR